MDMVPEEARERGDNSDVSGKMASTDTGSTNTDPSLKMRRFNDPGDAIQELYQSFNRWSVALATHSIYAAYAIIAANWAVHGSTNAILANPWAKASLAITVAFVGLNLLSIGLIAWLYKCRHAYANEDKKRWAKEFEQEHTKGSPWPYTHFIENCGEFLRFLRIIAPTIAGILFIFSLFFST